MERVQLFFESWEFFSEAAIGSSVAGALLGAIGIYILLGRMVFMSVTTAQVSSAGVVIAFWLSAIAGFSVTNDGASFGLGAWLLSPSVFSVLFTIGVMAGAGLCMKRSKAPESILAVLYLAGAALTVLIGTRIVHELQDVQQLLIGNAVLIEHSDFVGIGIMACVMIALFAFGHRAFEVSAFWPQTAEAAGIPVKSVNLVRMIALTVAIAHATRVMGALPVFAFSCLPALTARVFAPNLRIMFWASLAIGACAGFTGYVAAFVLDLPVGPVQTVLSLLLGILAFVISFLVKFIKKGVSR